MLRVGRRSVAGQERQQLLLAHCQVVISEGQGVVAVFVLQLLVGAALQEQLGHLDVGGLASFGTTPGTGQS